MEKMMPLKGNATPRIPECHPDRKHLARGMCVRCYDTWRNKLPGRREKHNQAARKYNRNNPEKRREAHRKNLYGISEIEIKKIYERQNGICKICGIKEAKHFDHCHKTGTWRGLLCGTCNLGLGLFKDNPLILMRAAKYIEENTSVIPNTGHNVNEPFRRED